MESRWVLGVRAVRRAELYKGVGREAASLSPEIRMFEWEGDSRCKGMGESAARTGIMQTRALSFVKSLGESSAPVRDVF